MEPMKPMTPMQPMKKMDPVPAWWPEALGQPAASGGQDDLRFAFFPDRRRVAVQRAGKVTVYDTGEHGITGMSDSGGTLSFTGPDGEVALDDLKTAS